MAARLARARTCSATVLFDEALAVARTPMLGEEVTEGPAGRTVRTFDQVAARKLLVDTLLKQAACYDPERFGLRQQVTHAGRITLEALVAGSLVAAPPAALADSDPAEGDE